MMDWNITYWTCGLKIVGLWKQEMISPQPILMLGLYKLKANGTLGAEEKHIPMVKLAAEHGLDAFIFDVYFIEDSERKLEYKVLNNIQIPPCQWKRLKNYFPDPDNDLADASQKAGNIIFAQSFKPQPKKKEPVKKRTDVMERRLKTSGRKEFFSTVDRDKYSMLFDFYDIETVVDTLFKTLLVCISFNQIQILMDCKESILWSEYMKIEYSLPRLLLLPLGIMVYPLMM